MKKLDRREMIVSAAALAFAMRSAHGAEKWVEGRHYFRIEPPQPAPRAGTFTVTEVFSYGCPGCNEFLPHMQGLEKKLPANVVVDYLHASWLPRENWPTLQRAYIAAKALGVAKKTHEAMFAAVWKTGELAITDANGRLKSKLPTIQDMAQFYQRVAAVPAAKFLETAKSFGVEAEMRRTDSLITALRADSTPTLVINGRYRVEPRFAGGAQQAVDLTLSLAR